MSHTKETFLYNALKFKRTKALFNALFHYPIIFQFQFHNSEVHAEQWTHFKSV